MKDLYKFISIQPLNFFAIGPKPLPLYSFFVAVETLSVLLTVLPLSFVGSSVRPGELSIALFLLVHVVSFILAAI